MELTRTTPWQLIVHAVVDDGAPRSRALARVHDALVGAIFLPLLAPVDDDLFVLVPVVLEGCTFTHRLTTAEQRAATLELWPDLAVLHEPATIGMSSTAGDRLVYDERRGRLLGPPGWLDHLPAGEMIEVRTRRGALELTPAADDELGRELVEAELLQSAKTLLASSQEPVPLRTVVWHAWAHGRVGPCPPALATSVPRPLGDIFRAAGYRLDGCFLSAGSEANGYG